MDQNGHIIDQIGLKMYEKKAKNGVFGPKIQCSLAEFSLAELGGTPLPPLTENHPAQKPLAERGGNPPPLNGKNPLSSF